MSDQQHVIDQMRGRVAILTARADQRARVIQRLIAHIARLEGIDYDTARLKHLGDS